MTLEKGSIRRIAAASIAGLACACGLSIEGTMEGAPAGDDAGPGTDAPHADAAPLADVAPPIDAADASSPDDAPVDAGCVALDAGLNGTLALSAFVTKGSAVYDENNDSRITLTNSNKNEKGAAWYPTQAPVVDGYDLTWTFRVGPNDTAGDGIAFAVLQAGALPGVGDDGDGIGLRNISASSGGVTAGYAVIVDMYKNANDPTDLDKTTLKIAVMPQLTIVATAAVPFALNDGNVYPVDVSWRAPSTLIATIHTPGNGTVSVTSSDPGISTTARPYFGFAASTGGASDSHNEIAGITFASTCRR